MKSLNLVTTLAIAAALMMGVTGCKHNPKNVTTIPRQGVTPIGEDPSANIKLGGPKTGTGVDRSNQLPGDLNPNASGLNGGTTTKPLTADELANAANQNARPPEGAEDRTTLAAETVLFDYDKASVKSSEVPKVQRVATYMKNQTKAFLRVEGNCDERGTE